MKFVCLDFETANRYRASVCAVGIAAFEDGEIIETKYWLVKPHKELFYFEHYNVLVHGITEDHVKNALEFNYVYEEMKPYLENATVVAHNASFDMSVLRNALDIYGLQYPTLNYLCTYKAAQKVWTQLPNYKLNTICSLFNFNFKHHHAAEDAVACGQVLVRALAEKKVTSISDFVSGIEMELGLLLNTGFHSACRVSGLKPVKSKSDFKTNAKDIVPQTNTFKKDHELHGKKFIFTGTLVNMSRSDAMQKVVDAGGYIGNSVTQDTDYLVLGIQDFKLFADGKESSKTKKAKELIAKGYPLQIIDEDDFNRMSG